MSRPSPRRNFDRYTDGSPCERKKPCAGTLELAREFGPIGWSTKWRIFRCKECGKKHMTKTRGFSHGRNSRGNYKQVSEAQPLASIQMVVPAPLQLAPMPEYNQAICAHD